MAKQKKFTELPHPDDWWLRPLATWVGVGGFAFILGIVGWLVWTHR